MRIRYRIDLLDCGLNEWLVVAVTVGSNGQADLVRPRVFLEGLHQTEYCIRRSLLYVGPPRPLLSRYIEVSGERIPVKPLIW